MKIEKLGIDFLYCMNIEGLWHIKGNICHSSNGSSHEKIPALLFCHFRLLWHDIAENINMKRKRK